MHEASKIKLHTGGCRVGFPALATCFTSRLDDFERRLEAQKAQSLLFEELDPREQNHAALVLLAQLIQTSAQRAHLRRDNSEIVRRLSLTTITLFQGEATHFSWVDTRFINYLTETIAGRLLLWRRRKELLKRTWILTCALVIHLELRVKTGKDVEG